MGVHVVSVVIDFILCSLLVILPGSVGIIHIKKKFGGKYKGMFNELETMDKLLVLSAIIGYGFLSITGIMVVCQGITYYSSGQNIDSTEHMIFNRAYNTFITLALLTNYYFVLIRVYTTFKESVYKVKIWIIYFNIIVMLIVVILGISIQIMIENNVYSEKFGNILFGIMLFLGIFSLTHAIYAFNSRLFKICVSHQRSISLTGQLSNTQLRILSVVRKHTILGASVIIFGIIGALDYIVANIVTNGEYNTLSIYLYDEGQDWIIIFDIIFVFMVLLAMYCIYLSFTENRNGYHYFCKYCDSRCRSICERVAQQMIDLSEEDVEENESHSDEKESEEMEEI